MTTPNSTHVPVTEIPNASAPARPEPDSGFSRLAERITQAALIVLMLRLAMHAVSPLANPDTFFHLRIGHELWGRWSLASPGSMTRFADRPWAPTQWSTEMLMAKVQDWCGLAGVAWLFGACYLALLLAVYFLCRRRADPLVAAVVTGAVFGLS